MNYNQDGTLSSFSDELEDLREENQKLKAQLEKAESVLKFYADEMSYTIDSYEGISGEMRSRVVLYGDSDERNDVYSYAGKRARIYFNQKDAR